MDIDELRSRLSQTPTLRPQGKVISVTGLGIRVAVPGARIGDVIQIERRSGAPVDAEIVGFDAGQAVAVPLGTLAGIGPDEPVHTTGAPLEVRAGLGLLGRVVDGLGRPLDGESLPRGLQTVPVDRAPPPALSRSRILAPLATGIRAVDGLLTLGIGQRVGLFSGSGVGKSSLLGALARGARADAVVVALVGERGREVGEFLDNSLGVEGRRRSVVVVTTSDASALERLRAAQVATALAEAMRDQGASVLLLVDSVTRFARAQREVGLAAGEPPARRGYPPSVFAALPRLLERAGTASTGSITAVYTVLVEGDDMDEPVADEVRGILDGHIVLDRQLASHGHYPAIDITRSISRVMPSLISPEGQLAATSVRSLIAAYEQKRDWILLGGYVKGTDLRLDRAVAAKPEIDAFLRQSGSDITPFEETWNRLAQLAKKAS